MSETANRTEIAQLSRVVGMNLEAYRHDHVEKRIQRALEREQVDDFTALVRRLRSDAEARSRFRRSVAVSVSGVFRDPAQFDLLEHVLLPPLVARGTRITVWSAGCANGSELYSIALLLERLGALERAFLLGTDLLEENLVEARRGEYADVTVPAHVRARLRWERRDLTSEGPPPGRFKLVVCRNVAIYLAADARQRLHEMLADAVAPGGILLLGRSERLADARSLGLEPAGKNAYRKAA